MTWFGNLGEIDLDGPADLRHHQQATRSANRHRLNMAQETRKTVIFSSVLNGFTTLAATGLIIWALVRLSNQARKGRY